MLLFFVVLWSFSYAQMGEEQYFVDIHGDLRYESRDRFQASLSTNIFGDKVYKDNRGNKVTYSKEFLGKIRRGRHRGDGNVEEFLLLGLAKDVGKKKNYTEEYTVDIFGNLEYKNSEGRRVSIKKDIFDGFEYLDDMLVMRVNRDEEFAPIKNKEGKDSPETAKEIYERNLEKRWKN